MGLRQRVSPPLIGTERLIEYRKPKKSGKAASPVSPCVKWDGTKVALLDKPNAADTDKMERFPVVVTGNLIFRILL